MTARSGSAFRGYRFPHQVIALAIRSSLRDRLRSADVGAWRAARGVHVDARTRYDVVRAFTPQFLAAARAHRAAVGRRWWGDATERKIGGRWRSV
jgi:transposase-like protein